MSDPVSAQDVAKYILTKQGFMSTMKLQKLVYYSHAWSLVWDSEPLFTEEVRAWRDGPVVKELFEQHRAMFEVDVSDIQGDANRLTEEQKATVDAVLADYGKFDGLTLSNLTHEERPWKDARAGHDERENSDVLIPNDSIRDYYSKL